MADKAEELARLAENILDVANDSLLGYAQKKQAVAALLRPHLGERPAVILGKKGGDVTAKRGPEYFRQINAMRKVRKGGRPLPAAPPAEEER